MKEEDKPWNTVKPVPFTVPFTGTDCRTTEESNLPAPAEKAGGTAEPTEKEGSEKLTKHCVATKCPPKGWGLNLAYTMQKLAIPKLKRARHSPAWT